MDEFKDKNVLVTGGCGFIGINLVRRLLEEGAKVYVIDNLSTGTKDDEIFTRKDCYVYSLNVNDMVTAEAVVSIIDYIFHLAASNILQSIKNPYKDEDTNIKGTLNYLIAANGKSENSKPKFIYTSSASVYGNPRYLPINEDDQINLLTPYAVSKFAGEGYCRAFYEDYGLPTTVLRLSNVYGPGQNPNNPYCGVVAKLIQSLMDGRPMQIHGNGNQTRDFTYVDDVVDALLLAALSPKSEGEVFNVASGIETSINELASRIYTMDWNDSHDKFYYLNEMIEYVDNRDIDNISRRVLNVEKIRRILRWIPKTTLQDGLDKTKQWMEGLESENKDGKKIE